MRVREMGRKSDMWAGQPRLKNAVASRIHYGTAETPEEKVVQGKIAQRDLR